MAILRPSRRHCQMPNPRTVNQLRGLSLRQRHLLLHHLSQGLQHLCGRGGRGAHSRGSVSVRKRRTGLHSGRNDTCLAPVERCPPFNNAPAESLKLGSRGACWAPPPACCVSAAKAAAKSASRGCGAADGGLPSPGWWCGRPVEAHKPQRGRRAGVRAQGPVSPGATGGEATPRGDAMAGARGNW